MTSKPIIMLLILAIAAKCDEEENEAIKSKNPFPYFRRQVEEVTEDSYIGLPNDDSKNSLMSFLVKNVKEIFTELSDLNEPIEQPIASIPSSSSTFYDFTTSNKDITHKEESTASYTDDLMPYKNLSIANKLVDGNDLQTLTDKDKTERMLKSQLMLLTREMKRVEKTDIKIFPTASCDLGTNETFRRREEDHQKRSCISCNNVIYDHCEDPQNKLLPSITCARDSDICYSLHTPFGIIERGCFSVNENLTIYVCACNLCNYIAISEMPHIFSTKYAWVDNVVELSRARNLRKSVYKDMACLRCEVNTTSKTGDMLDTANCLEGNIGSLPTQKCAETEVCAVKAVKSDGYIWRGCVSFPLYNYWFAFCEYDLCNYDSLINLYDFVTKN